MFESSEGYSGYQRMDDAANERHQPLNMGGAVPIEKKTSKSLLPTISLRNALIAVASMFVIGGAVTAGVLLGGRKSSPAPQPDSSDCVLGPGAGNGSFKEIQSAGSFFCDRELDKGVFAAQLNEWPPGVLPVSTGSLGALVFTSDQPPSVLPGLPFLMQDSGSCAYTVSAENVSTSDAIRAMNISRWPVDARILVAMTSSLPEFSIAYVFDVPRNQTPVNASHTSLCARAPFLALTDAERQSPEQGHLVPG